MDSIKWINGHVSKNPVILRIEFRTWLKSRPLRVLPLPVHTEKAIFPAIRRPMMTCGGTTSPSSDSSSRSSLSVRWNMLSLSGIFTGSEFAILFSFFLQYLFDALRVVRWSISWQQLSLLTWSGKITSDSWSSWRCLAIGKVNEKMREKMQENWGLRKCNSGKREIRVGGFIGRGRGERIGIVVSTLRLFVLWDGVTIKALSVVPAFPLLNYCICFCVYISLSLLSVQLT